MIVKSSWLLFRDDVLGIMGWNGMPLTDSCVKASAAGTIGKVLETLGNGWVTRDGA